MDYRIDRAGLVFDGEGGRIGPSVDRHKVVGTDRMDGCDSITVRLWSAVMAPGQDRLSAVEAKHNVQFRMGAADAKALAHAILEQLGKRDG